jgi:Kdo2-lipid IVA lauroyltransferase/acyltransferase
VQVNTTDGRVPLIQFWSPRYWPTWLLLLWMRTTAALPWTWAIRVHKGIGHIVGRLLRKRCHIVMCNLGICFPDHDEQELRRIALRHFENVGAGFAELAIAWFGPMEKLRPLFRVEGMRHVRAAFAEGKGVIFFSGHFTTLEICAPVLKSLVDSFAFMFRPRRNALLDELQARGRLRASHESFANTDIRAMLKSLRNNVGVWYAPDQAYRGTNARLLPFFGEPAMTNTATSRLARISGARVVPFFFCRLRDDSGYLLRFDSALEDFPSEDVEHDTRRLTDVLEGFIVDCPEQYIWMHRKFKGRPAEFPDVYARE